MVVANTHRPLRFSTLADILGPCTLETFFTEHWEQRVLLLHRRAPGYFDTLFSLRSLDALLARASVPFPGVRVFHNGRELPSRDFTTRWSYGGDVYDNLLDPAQLHRLYKEGATLNVLGLERSVPSVSLLNSALEVELGFPVHTTGFLTPPEADNIPPHQDAVDFFILQIHGTKQWKIWNNLDPWPLVDEDYSPLRYKRDGTYYALRKGEVVADVLLEPGATLYVPRGYIHEAATTNEPSLHLTIGVNVYRWFDAIEIASRQALNTIAEEQTFRGAIPPHTLRSPSISGQMIASMIETFVTALSLDDALSELDDRLLRGRYTGRYGQLKEITTAADLDLNSPLTIRHGLAYAFLDDDNFSGLMYHNKRLHLPRRVHSAVRWMEWVRLFQPRDIPGELTDGDRLALCRRLTREGFLVRE